MIKGEMMTDMPVTSEVPEGVDLPNPNGQPEDVAEIVEEENS